MWKYPKDKLEKLNNMLSEWPVGSPKTNKNYLIDKKNGLKQGFLLNIEESRLCIH